MKVKKGRQGAAFPLMDIGMMRLSVHVDDGFVELLLA